MAWIHAIRNNDSYDPRDLPGILASTPDELIPTGRSGHRAEVWPRSTPAARSLLGSIPWSGLCRLAARWMIRSHPATVVVVADRGEPGLGDVELGGDHVLDVGLQRGVRAHDGRAQRRHQRVFRSMTPI